MKETGRLDVVLAPPGSPWPLPTGRACWPRRPGVLALHGLDVRSANATSDGGVALEVFAVESSIDRWPAQARLRQDLEAVLGGTLVVEERLADKERAYAGSRRPSTPRPTATRVTLDDDASHTATVVEVFTADRIGLLHRVTKALFDCDLDVVSARVATLGAEVVDAFYVRSGGGKVEDATAARVVGRSCAPPRADHAPEAPSFGGGLIALSRLYGTAPCTRSPSCVIEGAVAGPRRRRGHRRWDGGRRAAGSRCSHSARGRRGRPQAQGRSRSGASRRRPTNGATDVDPAGPVTVDLSTPLALGSPDADPQPAGQR